MRTAMTAKEKQEKDKVTKDWQTIARHIDVPYEKVVAFFRVAEMCGYRVVKDAAESLPAPQDRNQSLWSRIAEVAEDANKLPAWKKGSPVNKRSPVAPLPPVEGKENFWQGFVKSLAPIVAESKPTPSTPPVEGKEMPCNCGADPCIGQKKLINPYVCVRIAGIKAIAEPKPTPADAAPDRVRLALRRIMNRVEVISKAGEFDVRDSQFIENELLDVWDHHSIKPQPDSSSISTEQTVEFTVPELVGELQECLDTIKFLYGCLELPGFKHEYPEQTRKRIEFLQNMVSSSPRCIHSNSVTGCTGCAESNLLRVLHQSVIEKMRRKSAAKASEPKKGQR